MIDYINLKKLIVTTLLVILFNQHALAQTEALPGVVDYNDRLIDSQDFPNSYDLDNREGEEELPKQPGADLDDSKELTILKTVSIEGNSVLKKEELKKVVYPYLDKALTPRKLASLKYEVKKAYYKKGYIFVIVVTQPQDISDGKLVLTVFEAKRADVKVVNDNVVSPKIANALAGKIKRGEALNEDSLESMASDFKELSGVDASLILKPGKHESTTDMMFILSEKDEDKQYVGIDNSGSLLTGKTQLYGHYEKSNFFNLGEKIAFDLRRSDEKYWMGNLSATTPTGINNIKLETSYLYSQHDIVGRLRELRSSGESSVFDVAMSKKLSNTNRKNITLRAGYQDRTHRSFLAGSTSTKDRLNKLYLESSLLYRKNNKLFFGSLKASKGISLFDVTNEGDVFASRNRGDQNAYIFEPSLLLHSRLFNDRGTLKIASKAQFASSALLSSDLFSIGGYGNVRGFPTSQESAEAGYNFAVEYLHRIPFFDQFNARVEFGPFLDGATVYTRIDGTVEDKNFYSTGLSLRTRYDMPKLGVFYVSLDWARPIGRYTADNIASDTFYYNFRKDF